MAKFVGKLARVPDIDFSAPDLEAQFKAQDAAVEELERISDNLAPGEVVGALLDFVVADGKALYVVVAATARSVSVAHVPFGDNYQVDPALIRGLTKKDVLQRLEQRRRFHALWNAQKRAS